MIRRTLQLALPATILALAVAAPRAATEGQGEGQPLWDDPKFRNEFLGSYGFLSDVEPSLEPTDRELWTEELYALIEQDPAAAKAKLAEITTAHPDASAAFDYTLGNLHLQDGEMDEARGHYLRAIDKFPSYRRAYKNLASIQVRQADYEGAAKTLSKVIELGSRDGLTFGMLGYSYMQTARFVSAEGAFREALLMQPESLDWKLGLTQAVYKQGKFAETASLCNELIGRDPEKAEYWLLQANAYIGLGQSMKAAQNYEILDRMGRATAPSLLNLGDVYVNEKLWDVAVRAYSRSMELDGAQAAGPFVERARALAERGAPAEAADLVQKIREAWGDRLTDEHRRALLKLEAKMSFAEGGEGAVAVLEEIVQLDPLDGEALLLLGQHYAKSEPEKAMLLLEQAERIPAHEADALVRRGQLLVEQGRLAEAVPLLKRAQNLQPREQVAQYLEQVERAARASR